MSAAAAGEGDHGGRGAAAGGMAGGSKVGGGAEGAEAGHEVGGDERESTVRAGPAERDVTRIKQILASMGVANFGN